ncbi:hypothetical protein GCM10022221_22530 [Actinocorallia aurea]
MSPSKQSHVNVFTISNSEAAAAGCATPTTTPALTTTANTLAAVRLTTPETLTDKAPSPAGTEPFLNAVHARHDRRRPRGSQVPPPVPNHEQDTSIA